jgi:hypothetical protein
LKFLQQHVAMASCPRQWRADTAAAVSPARAAEGGGEVRPQGPVQSDKKRS